MKKKFLFLVLLIPMVTTCVNAQNFTMDELVNVLKAKSIENAQGFLEKKGLTFVSVEEDDVFFKRIIYGYNPSSYNRAVCFVHLMLFTDFNGGFKLDHIAVSTTQKHKYDELLNTVKNTYGAKWIETITYSDNEIANFYHGKTMKFLFSTVRKWDDVREVYITKYDIGLYCL